MTIRAQLSEAFILHAVAAAFILALLPLAYWCRMDSPIWSTFL